MLSPSYELLDRIYHHQMSWTEQTRKFLYRKVNLFHSKRVLEIGSGTGRIIDEIKYVNPKIDVIGIDIEYGILSYMINKRKSNSSVINTSGENIPFQNNSFDITLCNWLLLWLKDPLIVLKEMIRVTRDGGWIVCLAEPDYGGRLDYPLDDTIKRLLIDSLRSADPQVGRKLYHYFSRLGINVQVGLQSCILHGFKAFDLYEYEIKILKELFSNQDSQITKLENKLNSLSKDSLFLFMPVFYAIARK